MLERLTACVQELRVHVTNRRPRIEKVLTLARRCVANYTDLAKVIEKR